MVTETLAKATESLEAGELRNAIEEITRVVRARPTDLEARTFLFELLCLTGEWERAEKQLDLLQQQDGMINTGVQIYINNIRAERDRIRLFTDGLQPYFLDEPPGYVDLQLKAINCLRAGQTDDACRLLKRVAAERPALSGKWNDRAFPSLRDYNDLMGPVLEVFVRDKYTWLPLEQIRRIEADPPETLRDLIWVKARIETRSENLGPMAGVFIPALYANSSQHSDDQIKLGRITEWQQIGGDFYQGAGLRMFLIDDEDQAILEMRNVEFDPPKSGADD